MTQYEVRCPECGYRSGPYPNRPVAGAQRDRHDERAHDGAPLAGVEQQVAADD
jgi:hypothetical protein